MSELSYSDYRDYYAKKCTLCNGNSIVLEGKIRKECICQKKARMTYRLERIDIYPPDLKYKSWNDFTGMITQEGKIVGHLKTESIIAARNSAFKYCYGVPFDKELVNRAEHLKVHQHLKDGQNIVIVGGERVGRSLLGAIICREVANSSIILNKDIDYRWIKFYDILHAAQWAYDNTVGSYKHIDYAYLEMLEDLDFLFIDGIDIQKGHTNLTDHVAMNSLFGSRLMFHKPTILICSENFIKLLSLASGVERISNSYGYEFIQMIKKSDNVFIELLKE